MELDRCFASWPKTLFPNRSSHFLRWGSYVFTMALLLAGVPSTHAGQPVFVNDRSVSCNFTQNECATTLPVNLDNLGDADINFELSRMESGVLFPAWHGEGSARIIGGSKEEVFFNTSNTYGAGAQISSDAGTEYYIAINFTSNNTEMVGWCRQVVERNTNQDIIFVLKDWAYQPASEGAIRIGDVTDLTSPFLLNHEVTDFAPISGTEGYTGTLTLSVSEKSTLYYIVADATSPTLQKMLDEGLQSIVGAGQSNSLQVAFHPTDSYCLYYVLKDEHGNLSNVNSLTITLDITHPTLSALSASKVLTGQPLYGRGDFHVDIAANASETSTFYYVVLPAGNSAPTVQDLLKGVSLGTPGYVWQSSASASFAVSLNKSNGLQEQKDYVFYLVARDLAHIYSDVHAVSFTTPDVTAPVLDASTPLTPNNVWGASCNEESELIFRTITALVNLNTQQIIEDNVYAAQTVTIQAQANQVYYAEVASASGRYASNEKYVTYAYCKDVAGNYSSLQSVEFTYQVDNQGPYMLNAQSTPSGTQIDISFTPDENGTVYAGAFPFGVAVDNAAIIAGTNAVSHQASLAITQGVKTSLSLPGLASETKYSVYLLLKDAKGNTATYLLELTTLDITAPVLSSPKAVDAEMKGVSLKVQSSEAGKVYYAVLSASATVPTATQIRDGVNALAYGLTNVLAATEKTLAVDNLQGGTAYKVYVFSTDMAGNASEVAFATFTTLADLVPPAIQSAVITQKGTSSATLRVTVTEAGKIYYMALRGNESTTVDVATLLALSASVSGSQAIGSQALDIEFNNLQADTDYRLYVLAVDESGNTSKIQLVEFATEAALAIESPGASVPFAGDRPIAYRVTTLRGQYVGQGFLVPGQSVDAIAGLAQGAYLVQLRQGGLRVNVKLTRNGN